jgi:hypothetical protein
LLGNVLFAASRIPHLWYALPLLVTISLVYAATRHEDMGEIVRHAIRFGSMVLLVTAIVFVVFLAMSWWVSAG